MTRIRIAINQNNIAVSMIETARYDQAIRILKSLIPQFHEDLRTQVTQNEHSEPRSALVHHLLLQSASTMLNRGTGACDGRHDEQQQEEGFLYDQAVEIPQKVALESHPIATDVVSSILLFNLALASQLKAIAAAAATEDPANNPNSMISDRCFAKSMSLYRLVMALNNHHGNAISRLLSMIILNNVALIHKRYKDDEKAKECFHHLLSIWMSSPPSVCPKDLEGMVYNAMLGWYDTSCALPAAAA